MRTIELHEEMIELWAQALIDPLLTDDQDARLRRLMREVARRDYRFRAHGRRCTCSDCWQMYETWTELRRRVGADLSQFHEPIRLPEDELQ